MLKSWRKRRRNGFGNGLPSCRFREKPTVKKLMVSYNYMKLYEPKLLEQAETEAVTLPDY